jgi:pilus assembly protein CpaD
MILARIVISLALMLCAAGCETPVQPADMSFTTETPNHVHVSAVKLTHTVRFAAGDVTPNSAEVGALDDFLAQGGGITRGDAVLVERHAGAMEDKRAARLVAALAHQGLRPAIALTDATPAGEMRLTVERYVAYVPNCPNWTGAPGNNTANTLHSDFGCATATNLAAMVADPRDLLIGREPGPVSGDAALAPIDRYRTGKVKPLISSDASSSGAQGGSASAGPSQ